VLLMACANVTNSCSRGRMNALAKSPCERDGRRTRSLDSSMLTQSVLLFCCGAAAAISFGWGALRMLLAMQPKEWNACPPFKWT